eukprot:1655174-Prorocentrum_lima.AAC.1
MTESFRPAHQRDEPMTLEEVEGRAPASGRRGRRICKECELRCRQQEWQSFTQEEKLANPSYATWDQ